MHTTTKLAAEKKGVPGTVSIRMYCIGTGDCFVLKFFRTNAAPFVMMIDCGSCQGDKKWFEDYIDNPIEPYKQECLKNFVAGTIDLLVITHEHTDHVTGFNKCSDVFKNLTIKEAWFAWTEDPDDTSGDAAELLKKRKEMKQAFGKAVSEVKNRNIKLTEALVSHPLKNELLAAQESFINGLDSLAAANLEEEEVKSLDTAASNGQPVFSITGDPLPGMKMIKEILKEKKVKIRYLSPGETVTVEGLDDIRFHVLGPPRSREFIFKNGKEGTDVFKKNMALNESALAAKAFSQLNTAAIQPEDLPFADNYIIDPKLQQKINATGNSVPATPDEDLMAKYYCVGKYKNVIDPATDKSITDDDSWRRIDDEWLMSAGSLALRLNSHINNTSLVLAVESIASEKVLLLPGDAEYGSWESWHLIENWKKKGKDSKHLVEDLLGRTVFYKVGHHLSYNGTALEKGINMMPTDNLVAMATLDLKHILKGWKSTMPNKHLLKDLIRRTGGRFFIMSELEIDNAPSLTLDPLLLDKTVYEHMKMPDDETYFYKQYTLTF